MLFSDVQIRKLKIRWAVEAYKHLYQKSYQQIVKPTMYLQIPAKTWVRKGEQIKCKGELQEHVRKHHLKKNGVRNFLSDNHMRDKHLYDGINISKLKN